MAEVGPAVKGAARTPVRREELRGHLAMLGFAAIVAGSFGLGGLAAPHVDPMVLTVLRFAVAVGVMGALVLLLPGLRRGGAADWRLGAAPWRWPVLGTLFAIYFVLMFEALKTAPVISTAAIFTLTPLMAAGFGWGLLGQRMGARTGLALGVGAVGALWVIFRGDPEKLLAFEAGWGEAIFFVGCIAHALFTPMVVKLNRGEPAAVSTALVMVGGLVVLLALTPAALMGTDWGALPPIVWITALYLGLPATAITFLCMRYAAMRLPAAKVMAYTYLVPSFVILWELALGQDAPPVLVLPGVALCVAALALLLKQEG
ncbi:MAG: DMT family transporter [Alkalilacustris sp.]